jgi:hypothetical protein
VRPSTLFAPITGEVARLDRDHTRRTDT